MLLPCNHFVTMVFMRSELLPICAYLQEIVGVDVDFVPWQDEANLPIYLQDRYQLFQFTLWEHQCLLMRVKEKFEDTPATYKKHWEQLTQRQKRMVVMGFTQLASYERKRLMDQGVPFVAANKQLFAPMLGVDLREYLAKKRKRNNASHLSATAQLIFLKGLHDPLWLQKPTAQEMANALDCSKMTISRAISDLELYGLFAIETGIRTKHLLPPADFNAAWLKAKPYLRNPVKKCVCGWGDISLNTHPNLRLAGEAALAEKTMLADPDRKTFALDAKLWLALKTEWRFEHVNHKEPGMVEIELWCYDPALLSQGPCVDVLSLTLSFKDVNDERIAMAVTDLEADYPWRI